MTVGSDFPLVDCPPRYKSKKQATGATELARGGAVRSSLHPQTARDLIIIYYPRLLEPKKIAP
jgi:hypothetical protein